MKELQESNNINNVRKFYQMVNKDRKTFKPKITICRDNLGNILTEKDKILEQWTKYFKGLLNVDLNDENNRSEDFFTDNTIDFTNDPVDTPNAFNDFNENYAPTIDEIQEVVKELRNKKAPGIDDIPSE